MFLMCGQKRNNGLIPETVADTNVVNFTSLQKSSPYQLGKVRLDLLQNFIVKLGQVKCLYR